jgi:hypothetical protein
MRSIYLNFRLRWIDLEGLPSHVRPCDSRGGPGESADDVGARPSREIVSIVWHGKSHLIDVAYDAGDTDHLEGPHQLAAELAADADLSLVPTRDGTVRWIKTSPDDW